ncbi:hypothetical protein H4219_006208 [Mycoemilia scoparia]|uniref:Uncharacterized protein n=1 Tax=Mycoemilia scoparia TaxID=417184 RepID=A0A9W7ZJ75_9FUNG|nr:hypothetical protein H4219_006208 [Mycoemilia scoparia]
MVKLYPVGLAILAIAAISTTATDVPYNGKPNVPKQQPAYVKPTPPYYNSAPYGISSNDDSEDCDWPAPPSYSLVPEPGYQSQPAQVSPPLPDNYSSSKDYLVTTITTRRTVTVTPSDCDEQQEPSPSRVPGSPYSSAPASTPPYINNLYGDVYNDLP